MEIVLVAALAKNRAIGKEGKLLFKDKEDMELFKKITLDETVIMGRKTWDSLPDEYKPLPQRQNIVLSNQKLDLGKDVIVCKYEDLKLYEDKSYCIIGGEEIYKLFIDKATHIVISQFREEKEGDTFFPEINAADFKEIHRVGFKNFDAIWYVRV